MIKKIISTIYLDKERAMTGPERNTQMPFTPCEAASSYSDNGSDAIIVFDYADTDAEHDRSIASLTDICHTAQIPVYLCGRINRMEDIKKGLYAGAKVVILNASKDSNMENLKEGSERFGKDRLYVSVKNPEDFRRNKELIEVYAGGIMTLDGADEVLKNETQVPLLAVKDYTSVKTESGAVSADDILKVQNIEAVCGGIFSVPGRDIYADKAMLSEMGFSMSFPVSNIPWSDFKLNADGLLPVISQDYLTDEVLILAYMNEEAYEKTLRTGKMTYWSRSRKELWTKGETSGHFQYVRSLKLDCDNDTMLAKVIQIGPACHTGHKSCFFQDLFEKNGLEKNAMHVLEDVYGIIEDRKANPKEGSYTNYLFNKGIDKILKKVGEENTEIIIAAKNPDPSEIKYEIADYLYHLMVLMVERGVTWEEITEELARR